MLLYEYPPKLSRRDKQLKAANDLAAGQPTDLLYVVLHDGRSGRRLPIAADGRDSVPANSQNGS